MAVARWLGAPAVAALLVAGLAPAVGAARPVGDTKVFARVPAPGQPEGIAVRDGVVFVGTHTSMAGNAGRDPSQLFRFDQRTGRLLDGLRIEGQTLAKVHGITGMAIGPDGRLYVGDRDPPRILVFDPSASPLRQETYAPLPNLPRCSAAPPPCAPSSNPGDALPDGLAFDGSGFLYVTDVQKATIFRVPPGGGAGDIWFQDPRLDGPFGVNGIAVEPTGRRLVVAVTISNQPDSSSQGNIYALPLVDRPGPGDLALVHRYPEPMVAPDGITFGRSGRLYVALAGSNQISILDPAGAEVARFPTGADNARQEIPYDTPASPLLDGTGRLLVTNQSYVNAAPQHWAVLDTWVDDAPL